MQTCLVVFLVLLLASIVLQWFRAKKRKQLVGRIETAALDHDDQEKWLAIDRGFDFIFKDFRKLQIFKPNLAKFGGSVQSEFERYRRLSRIEISVTISMFLFGVTAFLFCGSG